MLFQEYSGATCGLAGIVGTWLSAQGVEWFLFKGNALCYFWLARLAAVPEDKYRVFGVPLSPASAS